MKIIRNGHQNPLTAIIGCLHGNEEIGRDVINKLRDVYATNGSIKYIVANEEAWELDQRFIETDLNRSFPGNLHGSHEEQLAYVIMQEIAGSEYVLDIHSTTADTEAFIITVGENDLAPYFPLPRVVDVSGFAQGNSLIENVNRGISVEYSPNTPIPRVKRQVEQFLINLGVLKGTVANTPQQKYLIYGPLEKTPETENLVLTNFVETEFEGETFTPILCGENEYKGILCLKARKV